MTDIFRDADNVWCTQLSQERDALKRKSLGANGRSRNRIMTDIYGSQDDVLLQNGLADSEDFQIKLANLKTAWESLVPWFHRWFTKHSSEQFKTCLVLSARQNLGITGRFYTNGSELKHRLQKKCLREDEIPKEVANVTSMLERRIAEFYLRKKGLFVVRESIGLFIGMTSFKSTQWSGTGRAQKGKTNTYQHCVTSHRSHMTCIRNPRLLVLNHLHRVRPGESTCQNPKSSPTELKLAMINLK